MEEIEEVLFRASGSGALMTQKQGAGITDIQLKKIEELLSEKLNGVNAAGNKVRWEGTKKPEELAELIKKRDAPPELSDTAKAFVRKIWLKKKKRFAKDIKSKFLDKGTYNEEEGVSLVSEIDGIIYSKNDERRRNEDHEGECDIFKEVNGKKIVHDIKLSWDAETYMAAKPTNDNEWQGRIYMELWDADEFHLRYCLVDCPPHLVTQEKYYLWKKYFHESMSVEEQAELEERLIPLYEQIDLNLVFSNNPLYTKEERVKTFIFYRDKEKMAEMKVAVKLAREYYKTLTLNGIN